MGHLGASEKIQVGPLQRAGLQGVVGRDGLEVADADAAYGVRSTIGGPISKWSDRPEPRR